MDKKEEFERDFEVWFDDTDIETADRNQKLPALNEEQEKNLNARLEKTYSEFFSNEKIDETKEISRIAV